MAGSFIGGCWNEARDETDGGKGKQRKTQVANLAPVDVHRSACMQCGSQDVTGQILFLFYPGVPLKHDPAFRGPIRGKSRLVGCRAAYTPWTVAIAGLVSISYPVE